MKIRWINWLNLCLVPLMIFYSILKFMSGDIVSGIVFIVIAVLNAYAFLIAVDNWWMYSKKVSDNFVFTCKHCGHQFIPSFWKWFFVPHIASRRYMKCEKCKKLSLMRRK